MTSKQKIAICLFGLVGSSNSKGGKGDPLDPSIACKAYHQHFCNHYDVDFYIHTWSYQYENQLKNLFKPKAIITEKPYLFDSSYWMAMVSKRLTLRQKIYSRFNRSLLQNLSQDAYRAFSRWSSTFHSFNLIPDHSLRDYSFILSSRLDLEFFDDFHFPVNLSQSELLLSHWNEAVIAGTRSSINQLNLSLSKVGFMDLWFGGSPSAMDKYLKLIDYFHKYHYSPHISSFQHAVSCNLKPRYRYYRGLDYELVRRHRFNSTV